MHIGHNNQLHTHEMGQVGSRKNLQQVTCENDLGVTFQNNLLFHAHISEKVKPANSLLGMVHSSLKYLNNDIYIHGYHPTTY